MTSPPPPPIRRAGTESANRERLGDFYLYPLPERTTIANAQTKQVSFLDAKGVAAGAGCSLALACDMVVAANDAFFSMAYVKVGLSPDGGATAFLARCMSRQLLTELCLLGERVPAETAA